MKYYLKTANEIGQKCWDDFIEKSLQGSIHQRWAWRDFQCEIPGRERVLGFGMLDADNQIVALTWCVGMQTGFGQMFWWYSPRGPVLRDVNDVEKAEIFIEKIVIELQKSPGIFWRLDPYWGSFFWDRLDLDGLQVSTPTQNYQPTDSLVLDISVDENVILAQMKRKGRYNIKLAQKHGITVKMVPGSEITPADIDLFYALNQETTVRDGFSGQPKNYYANFLQKLPKTSFIWFAEFNGETIAAAILTVESRRAIYYYGASSGDKQYRPLMAPYLLQWEMICYAKAKGALTYDFTGISPEGVLQHDYDGITQFKTKFGGKRKTYDPGKEIIFCPFKYKLYRTLKFLKKYFRRR